MSDVLYGTRAGARVAADRALLVPLFGEIKACRRGGFGLWRHSVDVGRRARLIAAQLGGPRSLQRLAYLAGLLHDLGKVAVHADTLFKPGPLTPDELAHVREHPRAGARLIAQQYAQRAAADDLTAEARREIEGAIRHHHEAWNGGGYPDGLSGERIPFLARVVSVADWYEALREPRVYRPGAMSHERAMAIIEEAAARGQFDGSMVRALAASGSQHAPR
jgi:HD-GYP domain-containing protein (c-di-GMP phosphodiesterase class II)